MDVALTEHAGAFAGDPIKIEGAGSIHLEEGAKHGGDENCASGVWFGRFVQDANIRLVSLPFSSLWIDLAKGVSQGASTTGRFAELLGELAEQVFGGKIAARPRDLVAQHAWIGKMLEQRDDIGESFVKRQDVRIHRLVKAGMNAVEQRVRRLMRDYVVR